LDLLIDLRRAIDKLPKDEGDCVRERFRERSFAEIARAQGISEKAAQQRTYRGLARLRKMLGSRHRANR
jgi:DNA-directed RNA polymerase specialized sigma24 family protein